MIAWNQGVFLLSRCLILHGSRDEQLGRNRLLGCNESSANLIQSERMLWIVMGDRAKIKDKIRALDPGTLSFVDTDGNSL